MIRHLIIAVVAASAVGASAAGCSSGGTNTTLAPGIAWAARVCGAMRGPSLTVPAVTANDPARARRNLVTFLSAVSARLKGEEGSLRVQGAPPVAGGRAALNLALNNLDRTRLSVDSVTAGLNAVKITTSASLTTAIRGLGRELAGYDTYQGPVKDLKSNASLNQAFNEAPACR